MEVQVGHKVFWYLVTRQVLLQVWAAWSLDCRGRWRSSKSVSTKNFATRLWQKLEGQVYFFVERNSRCWTDVGMTGETVTMKHFTNKFKSGRTLSVLKRSVVVECSDPCRWEGDKEVHMLCVSNSYLVTQKIHLALVQRVKGAVLGDYDIMLTVCVCMCSGEKLHGYVN